MDMPPLKTWKKMFVTGIDEGLNRAALILERFVFKVKEDGLDEN